MNDDSKAALRERLGNIDQIRDILFGSQLRDYNTRLEQVETTVSILQQEIRDRTDDLKQSMFKELQAAVDALEKKIKSLTLKDNEEKVDIRQQLDRLSKRLSANVTTLDETIDKQTSTLRDDLTASREKLQGDILDLRNQIFEELDKRIANLTKSKIARADMAEILFEVGLRLKGSEFVPELKEAADPDSGYLLPEKSGN
ncbi:MAG TPA: hypothetical protein IGS17_13460 [Oscillatoriales cyanobacterium M59_W2019_021]|nr:MAG: hypothetical protein D6728_17585 [Cyanobacteria bacterium J055]HIK30727.1 hypothetical protein [Oscillatoriales cyanobacterium M4454_W2019_049]HIK51912.1 hypothetical protein [Oscillatoriales cyanobacterium M59_W2019_021]